MAELGTQRTGALMQVVLASGESRAGQFSRSWTERSCTLLVSLIRALYNSPDGETEPWALQSAKKAAVTMVCFIFGICFDAVTATLAENAE